MSATICTAPECRRPVRATGLCASHYAQVRRGHALRPLREEQDLVRVQVMLPKAVVRELTGRGQGGVSAAARAVLIDWFHSARQK
jgi:hypothetical protein